MSIRLTCPECSAQFPFAAGVLDDDGKRLAALTGEMEPAFSRAALAYLRLFKPAKTALRTSRALLVLTELKQLVDAGSVCKDERGGLRRPATFKHWVSGIEHMLQQDGRLSLPLANHNYLRSIVFGLADAADAKAEQQHNANVRAPKQPERDVHADWLREQVRKGLMTQEECAAQLAQRAQLKNIAGAALSAIPAKQGATP